ncbi:MAG: histidinol dehydrogenase [bacterium]|nr:histidinol dehydrogenase [bacterium]
MNASQLTVFDNPGKGLWPQICKRPTADFTTIEPAVRAILRSVLDGGDKAVLDATERYDGVRMSSSRVPNDMLTNAAQQLTPLVADAIAAAMENIRQFHDAQRRRVLSMQTSPGVTCSLVSRPLERVGIYIPGGTAPLFSSVLMLAVPAITAGVKSIALATPPDRQTGLPHTTILAVAALCGITEVYCMGGAQAIAALAYGTETIAPVRKIVGPGNAWVTAAKQLVSLDACAIDLPAGPSEVLVFCDENADAYNVALDLLAQAEHGVDSQVMVVTTSRNVASNVQNEIIGLLPTMTRRETVTQAMVHARCVVFDDLDTAIDFVNVYAPEHLIIQTIDDDAVCERINHAGSIFLGSHTPESLGDYASGTNHTLPTGGWASSVSGVTLDTFQRTMTVQRASLDGLRQIAPIVEALALAEGLDGHAAAVTRRRAQAVGLRKIPNQLINLDMNENEWGSPFGDELHRYPDSKQQHLRSAIADLLSVPTECIVCGNGSDELIDLLIQDSSGPVVVPSPTFGMYARCAFARGREVLQVSRNYDGSVSLASLSVIPDGAIVFLCNPNNPTGTSMVPEVIVQYATSRPHVTVVVDEAYIDFSEDGSCVSFVQSTPNVVVLRTFSKAWGLAAFRCGVAIAAHDVVHRLDQLRAPYNVSGPAQQMVAQAIGSNRDWVKQCVVLIKQERERLSRCLSDSLFVRRVYPSQANFLFIEGLPSQPIEEMLSNAGIRVRTFHGDTNLVNHVRITVGTPQQNDRVIAALCDATADLPLERDLS